MDATPQQNPVQYQTIQSQPQFIQQPQPQVVYVQTAPKLIPYNRGWHITKIVFNSIAIVFAIIILGIGGGALTISYSGDSDIFFEVILCAGPPAGVSIIWCAAELITICARGGKRGIHPGAQVGLHLLLWLGYVTALSLLGVFAAFDVDDCDGYDYCDDDFTSVYDTGVAYRSAGMAFCALLIIIHFTLFVGACIDTHKRNSIASATMIQTTNGAQIFYQPAVVQKDPQAMQTMPLAYPTPPSQAHLSVVGYPPSTIQQMPQREMQHETMQSSQPQELRGQTTGNTLGTYAPSVSNQESASVSADTSTPSHQHEIMTHSYA